MTDRSAEVYAQALRAMNLEQKLRVAEGLRAVAWQMQENAVRRVHPDWSDRDVYQQVCEMFLRASA